MITRWPIPLRDQDVPRFWSYVIQRNPNECWLWQGPLTEGYGRFSVRGNGYPSHRVAYAIGGGELHDGELVLHDCDNRACCNFTHLHPGNHSLNTLEMYERGRGPNIRGKMNGSHTQPHRRRVGELHGCAKITVPDVIAIRDVYATGLYKQREIALIYGISISLVSCIVRRALWKHIGDR